MRAAAESSVIVLLLAVCGNVAYASDACTGDAIVAAADVTMSDGASFRTESFFHTASTAAIRHWYDEPQMMAVEGPTGWSRKDGAARVGSNLHRSFALGHQFHALLLRFNEIMNNAVRSDAIPYRSATRSGWSGDYPYGGKVHLVDGGKRPAGMVFEFPGHAAMHIEYSNWRDVEGTELPFRVTVDDGTRVFDYRFTSVTLDTRSPGWFAESAGQTGLPQVDIYRLHRALLAAHCAGDFDRMADLSTESVVSANRGVLSTTNREAMRDRFRGVFEQVSYTAYTDLIDPVIEVSESGETGWIAVNVRAQGVNRSANEPFDDQWAWIMTVRKVDGQWLHAGNASNAAVH